MRRPCSSFAILAALSGPLCPADLPPDLQAKFTKILATSAGSPGRIACKDPALQGAFGTAGLALDPEARVAWASREAEVKAFKSAGKLVICGRLDLLPAGGAIAVIEEGGRPQIYLHMGNVAASGVTLADSVLKIGKRL